VNWGAGRGFDRTEYDAFDVTAEESYPRFREHVDIVRQVWTSDRLAYHGRYWDFESWGMVEACSAFIDEGRARIIAVDGIDWQSWTNQSISPADRGRRHDDYDRYLADELVPFVRDLSGWERAWATGASMGGYHAANVTFHMMKVLCDGITVGPLLLGSTRPAHILIPSVTSRGTSSPTCPCATT